MSPNEMAEMIYRALDLLCNEEDTGIKSVESFNYFGTLTKSVGLVIEMDNSQQFQITIIEKTSR